MNYFAVLILFTAIVAGFPTAQFAERESHRHRHRHSWEQFYGRLSHLSNRGKVKLKNINAYDNKLTTQEPAPFTENFVLIQNLVEYYIDTPRVLDYNDTVPYSSVYFYPRPPPNPKQTLFTKQFMRKRVIVETKQNASFTCHVNSSITGHRVSWLSTTTRALLAIDSSIIAGNTRMSVKMVTSHQAKLTISNVIPNDTGEYMCQLNTEPVATQKAFLFVTKRPNIESKGSADVSVNEGSSIVSVCEASGIPVPTITWEKELTSSAKRRRLTNGPNIEINHGTLTIKRADRSDIGVYVCIASNSIQAASSHRRMFTVNFNPSINVPNQLFSAIPGENVTFECTVEASPSPILYWHRNDNYDSFENNYADVVNGNLLNNSTKTVLYEKKLNQYTYKMVIVIRNLTREDFGTYICSARNSIGIAEGKITINADKEKLIEMKKYDDFFKKNNVAEITTDDDIFKANKKDDDNHGNVGVANYFLLTIVIIAVLFQ